MQENLQRIRAFEADEGNNTVIDRVECHSRSGHRLALVVVHLDRALDFFARLDAFFGRSDGHGEHAARLRDAQITTAEAVFGHGKFPPAGLGTTQDDGGDSDIGCVAFTERNFEHGRIAGHGHAQAPENGVATLHVDHRFALDRRFEKNARGLAGVVRRFVRDEIDGVGIAVVPHGVTRAAHVE